MARSKMRPIHPGEILREEFLIPLEMSAHALSQAIRVPATRVNDIVNGRRGVTADTALRLARYFGNSAEFWLNLQAAYDLRTAERDVAPKIEKEILPRKAA
jgi:addiction module HigA family antidote